MQSGHIYTLYHIGESQIADCWQSKIWQVGGYLLQLQVNSRPTALLDAKPSTNFGMSFVAGIHGGKIKDVLQISVQVFFLK